MMNAIKLLLLFTIAWSSTALAAYKDTDNVKVQLISVWTSGGDVLVQTYPKADISGLSCTNDYWLVLDKDELGYKAALSMLLSAQTLKSNIMVRAADNNGSEFCRLERVINKAN